MRTEGSIEIDRPIDDVFRLTNEHVADWSLTVVEDTVIERQPGEVGTTFRTVTEENGRRMEFLGEVTQYDPPYLSRVFLKNDMFDIDVEYTFEDLGEGRTRVSQRSEVHPKGFFRIAMFVIGWMMRASSCKAVQNEFDSLKQFCESYDADGTPHDTTASEAGAE